MKTKYIKLVLPALLCISLGAAAETRSKLPSQITTLDGRTYSGVAEQPVSVWPDGIVVQYQPAAGNEVVPGAVGEAKLKFRDLPDDVRNAYHYDAKNAADYEAQQAQATAQWAQAQSAEERSLMRYRTLAELNWSLAGNEDTSYSVSMDAAGKVIAQGTTRTTPAFNSTNVTIPTFTWWGYRNGLQTDYAPIQILPYNSAMVTR
jgi:hypothetical protein